MTSRASSRASPAPTVDANPEPIMETLKQLFAHFDYSYRALSVLCLTKAAKVVRRITVKLYVRGTLTSIEMRYLLEFSSAISRASVRLLRPPRK